ncbi:MAG: FHIPEP family type III secretion protein [Armatimonadetes bacterium]|nr:FHIPEP family type III secretion protein [Armatimonadota bacterium]
MLVSRLWSTFWRSALYWLFRALELPLLAGLAILLIQGSLGSTDVFGALLTANLGVAAATFLFVLGIRDNALRRTLFSALTAVYRWTRLAVLASLLGLVFWPSGPSQPLITWSTEWQRVHPAALCFLILWLAMAALTWQLARSWQRVLCPETGAALRMKAGSTAPRGFARPALAGARALQVEMLALGLVVGSETLVPGRWMPWDAACLATLPPLILAFSSMFLLRLYEGRPPSRATCIGFIAALVLVSASMAVLTGSFGAGAMLGVGAGLVVSGVTGEAALSRREPAPPPPKKESVTELLPLDPIGVWVGRGLLSLLDPNRGAPLLQRVSAIRRHLAEELGFVLPGIRFRDRLALRPNHYEFELNGSLIARGDTRPDRLLAIAPQEKLERLPGERVCDPAYGMPGVWIRPEHRGDAEGLGAMIFDPMTVVAAQLTELVRKHAWELLGHQEADALTRVYRKSHPGVVLRFSERMELHQLKIVLQNLLREQVSIRDLVGIMEALIEHHGETGDLDELTELVRRRLGRSICSKLREDRTLWVFVLPEDFEKQMLAAGRGRPGGWLVTPDGPELERLFQLLEQGARSLMEKGLRPVLLCRDELRLGIRRVSRRRFPDLAVLAQSEIPEDEESLEILAV